SRAGNPEAEPWPGVRQAQPESLGDSLTALPPLVLLDAPRSPLLTPPVVAVAVNDVMALPVVVAFELVIVALWVLPPAPPTLDVLVPIPVLATASVLALVPGAPPVAVPPNPLVPPTPVGSVMPVPAVPPMPPMPPTPAVPPMPPAPMGGVKPGTPRASSAVSASTKWPSTTPPFSTK